MLTSIECYDNDDDDDVRRESLNKLAIVIVTNVEPNFDKNGNDGTGLVFFLSIFLTKREKI